MKKTIDMTKGITINADLFIIPNSAGRIEQFISPKRQLKLMEEICEMNGMSFNQNENYLIETWICSDEFECDNFADHSIYTEDENGERCIISMCGRYLPSNLFAGKHEGDVINVKLPVSVRIGSYENPIIETTADFSITLAQTKYRYSNFGAFEEVLDKVMR